MLPNIARISYSIPQVMDALNLSRASVYKLINSKRLRTYRVGRRRMASHNALEDLIEDLEKESNGEVAA
jgi:excisionase family DNA binding protein